MATENFNRTVMVNADRDRTWATITDVDEMASWVGIVHDVEVLSFLEKYKAVLEDKVGPFRLRANLGIDVVVPEDRVRVELTAAGRDRAVDSKIAINASLELGDVDSGGTSIAVQGTYQVTGRAASMGGGIIRKKADGVLNDFFSNAEKYLA